MSAPNKSYDPVEVAVLAPEALRRTLDDGLAAIAGAGDLAALAAVRTAHLGDRAPISLAKREIGALPPQAKADAGKRVNEVLQALKSAYADRQVVLEAERDQ